MVIRGVRSKALAFTHSRDVSMPSALRSAGTAEDVEPASCGEECALHPKNPDKCYHKICFEILIFALGLRPLYPRDLRKWWR